MRLALLVFLVACSSKPPPDECERAMARLARINKDAPFRPTAESNKQALAECRGGTNDPVMRCALDAATDDAADACMKEFVDAVMPNRGSGTPSDGSGLNPLLEPND